MAPAVLQRLFTFAGQDAPHGEREENGRPDSSIQARERFGGDANDGEIDSIQTNCPSDGRAVAGVLGVPIAVSKNCDAIPAGDLSLLRLEGPADRRRDPEDPEEVIADHHAQPHPRLICGRRANCQRGVAVRNQPGKRLALLAYFAVVGVRYGAEGVVRGGVADGQHFGRPSHRKGAKQKSVGEAEHGAVRSNAQSERNHRHRHEARLPAQRAKRVADIGRDALQPRPAPCLPGLLGGQSQVAEFPGPGDLR